MMSKEVEEAINYFEDREISMKVDVDTDKLLKALGVTEEDSFDKQVYRMKTLINRIKELEKGITRLKDKNKKLSEEIIDVKVNKVTRNFIPKQVIRDKIEEIEKDKDSKYYYMFYNERDIDKVVYILTELLESEE